MMNKTFIVIFIFLFFKAYLFSWSRYLEDKSVIKIASYDATEDTTIYDTYTNEELESGYLYIIDFQIGYFREGNNITVKISGENGDVVYSSEEYKNLIKIETVAYTLEGKKKNNKAEGSENANLLPLCKVGDTLQVDNNTELFILHETKLSSNVSKIVIFVDKKKYAECDFYMLNGGNEPIPNDKGKTIGEYIYIDRLNKQFYYVGDKGMLRYDIKRNKIEEILKPLQHKIMAPMRLPNTPYLVFGVGEGEDKRGIQEIYTSIYIKEIPEWKAEIEKQEENKKLYPNAKKAFIDGPANIRDNPKGKNIVMLDDWIEVLALEQKGNWYEILYADVRGWTYKDNLRDIK